MDGLPDAFTFATLTKPYFIQAILPLALRGTFTYRVPGHLVAELEKGKRVVVPFGKRRYYAALIYKLNVQLPQGTKPKDIAYVMDDVPVVTDEQLKFWEWMAHYYMSGLGSVMNTALPNAMKISSQTAVSLSPEFEEYIEFSDDERLIVAQLSTNESMTIDQLEQLLPRKATQKAVSILMKQGVIVISEEMKPQAKPQMIEHVSFAKAYNEDASISALLNSLSAAPKQFEIVMRFLEMRGEGRSVVKQNLLRRAEASLPSLKALLDRGVFEIEEVLKYSADVSEGISFNLNVYQEKALEEIKLGFLQKTVVLLQGVTGSGKTLIYTQLIKETVVQGKQVLYLVPEIAVTTQLVARLKVIIGEELFVYHSRFSNRERLTTWMRLLDSANNEIVIGARSSLFLPLNNLGLIIVDEEHESSFKQHESSPHYNARDAAIWLAHETGAKVLLGSATPAIESIYNARNNKSALVKLDRRYADIQLPLIHLVDMTNSKRADVQNASFSGELIEAIKATLAMKQQVILFQNRRGYAPFLLCESCGWSAECVNCDVNLTYHRFFEKMLCHYCGYNIKMPKHCPNCHSAKMTVKGFGTEKIEDELEIIFPNARMGRMDLDTTRKKNAFQNIMTAFEEGSIDILVGTQMVTKGLDFSNVGLVGVLSADNLWNRPDFRAFERAYQLLTQVSGRAGRKNKRGKVLIQTFRPEHPVLQLVVDNNYGGMYQHQLSERQQFMYPPFVRMIMFQLAHPDAKLVREGAVHFGLLLRKQFSERVLGPEAPVIPRVRGSFLRQIFLKLDVHFSVKESRRIIWNCIDEMEGHPEYRKIKLRIDVDPY